MFKAILVTALAFPGALDGETVGIAGERIRIANIDAPELHRAKIH